MKTTYFNDVYEVYSDNFNLKECVISLFSKEKTANLLNSFAGLLGIFGGILFLL